MPHLPAGAAAAQWGLLEPTRPALGSDLLPHAGCTDRAGEEEAAKQHVFTYALYTCASADTHIYF